MFIWHLAIEKAIKARIIEKGKKIIYTHDLVRLAKESGLEITDEEKDHLYEITTYNLEARYDDFKLSFYKKATKEYSKKWIKNCENIYKKLRKEL